VIDADPTSMSAGGWLEDTSLVEKYTISEDAYNKREDTFRKYREKRVAEDPTWTLQKVTPFVVATSSFPFLLSV
jgi:tubulin-folding cofactor B